MGQSAMEARAGHGGFAPGRRRRWAAALAVSAALASGAGPERPRPPAAVETVRVMLGGEAFELELALDPHSRFRGLSGRGVVPADGGMLFVHSRPRPAVMVMRHCPVPIDVAFLDGQGRVLSLFSMTPETPRRADESEREYEARLPRYPSGWPVQFAIELAGGRLSELGIEVGQRLDFDHRALAARAK